MSVQSILPIQPLSAKSRKINLNTSSSVLLAVKGMPDRDSHQVQLLAQRNVQMP